MHTFTYGMIRKIFNLATYGALGMEVIGEENIPEKGPFIVVCNHASNFDPPLLGTAMRRHLIHFMAKDGGVILDGRDIGTVVLPDADLKVFLTASVESRARRRYLEVQAKGGSETYEDIAASIAARDDMDSHRAVSPLKKADDAIVVDNSDLDLEQTADVILGLMKERG